MQVESQTAEFYMNEMGIKQQFLSNNNESDDRDGFLQKKEQNAGYFRNINWYSIQFQFFIKD